MKSLSLPLSIIFVGLAPYAAAQSRFSYVGASATNRYDDSGRAYFGYETSFQDGSFASVNSTKSWSGWDSNYSDQEMTFDVKASALSNYGQLKASVEAKVSNPYFNSDNNPYYIGDGNPDDAGSPDSLYGFGSAGYQDVLQYTGTGLQSGYKARYIFYVHGIASGTNAAATLTTTIGSNTREFIDFDLSSGMVGEYWSTQAYTIDTSFKQTANVALTTGFRANLWNESEGFDLAGTANFSSTITLAAIQVYDQNDNFMPNIRATGSDGKVYPNAVPEPASLAAVGLGIAAMLRRRQRK